MSDYVYFRGSSSYEDAVKNRLEALEAAGVANMNAISNMNDSVTNAIQDMTVGIRSDLRESTYAIVASQAILEQTFVQGFGMIGNKLDAMSASICSKLDEIHEIVNNPLLTQSRELFRRALNNYNRKYYEEALEDCKSAVEKNKTDFISWNLLGQIYLFGAGKFSNVIDIDKAEEAFFTAAKYIDSDIGHSEEANILASEIYYYLGVVRLIKSNDYLVENKTEDSNAMLIEAEKASNTAYKLSNKNLFAGYEQAKELHFLGKDDEALSILRNLIGAEKNFAILASNDKNFESMWEQIDDLIKQKRDLMVDKIINKCDRIRTVAEKRINDLKSKIAEAKLPNKNEVDNFDFFYRNTSGLEGISSEKYKKTEIFISIANGLPGKKYYHGDGWPIAVIPKFFLDTSNKIDSCQRDFDYVTKRIENTLSSFEIVKDKDFFFVVEKYKEFCEELAGSAEDYIENHYKSNLDSKRIIAILRDAETLCICIAAQKVYEEKMNIKSRQDIMQQQQKTLEQQKQTKHDKKKISVMGIVVLIIVVIIFIRNFIVD